tara:strand:- start:596 stop:928 length:333 start_codon:yes stop_codon:yes gene_type:complete
MKKNNLVIISLLIPLFLNSCGTVAEGLGGSKKKGNEEFLVEKKSPLVLPPSFGELPEPRKQSNENKKSNNENNLSIEKIITQESSTDGDTKSNKTNSSIEKSIIEKINEK